MAEVNNTSGLRPEGHAVLLEPYEPEISRSIIEVVETNERTSLENRGVVIAVGASAWIDEPRPRAKIGEKVIVTKLAGAIVKGPADGKKYRIVNDRDIYCVIEQES